MGRSSKKSRENREQRKQEAAKIVVAQALVNAAKKQENPLSSVPAFCKYEKDGFLTILEFSTAANLDSVTKNAIWEIIVRNMKHVYEQCEWGWKDSVKREELFDEDACYLLARDSKSNLIAFSHFRFDLDFGRPVLYCYELQLTGDTRRKGLGRRMMQVLELLAWKAEMEYVVLTVLKHNQEACAFFHAMKYQLDDTSPEDSYDEIYCYEILSKQRKTPSAS